MSDQSDTKKITNLRTFATDAKYARLRMPTKEMSGETSVQPKERVEDEIEVEEKTNTLRVEMAQVGKSERGSILSDTDLTYQSEGTNEGIIIRDKRHKRFKLLPAMIEASTSWFTKIQDDHTKRLDRIPKIKTAESRIEIIKEAVEGSEQAPKEDYASVALHLQNTKRVPIATAISFKEKSTIPEPTWSSLTDTEDSKDATPVVDTIVLPEVNEMMAVNTVAPEKESDAIPVVITPHLEVTEVREQVIDTALDALFDSKEVSAQAKVPVIAVVLPTENAIPEIIQETEIEQSQPQEEMSVTPMEIPRVETILKPRVQYAPPREINSRTSLYLYLFIGVIIISSLCGVLVTYYIFSLSKTSSVATVGQETKTASPSLLHEQSSKTYIMPRTATEHILEIEKNIKSSEVVTRLIPNLQAETITREATAEEIFASLTLSAPPSFVRSIKEVTMGGVNGKDMFIVLRVSAFDTAFAGMLAWEDTIQSDFSPLFNTNQSRALTFTDTLTSNKNTRLLKDTNGEDVLTYTFTDKNTILITSTRTILEQLIPLVK